MKNYKQMLEAKKVLIVVDLLKGFVDEGILSYQGIREIIPEAVRLVDEFIKEEQPVIFIKDAHTEDSVEFKSFPKHCIKGTKEAELVDELIPYEEQVLVAEKNAISAMTSPEFTNIINQMNNLNETVIIGCESDMCVAGLAMPLKSYFDQQNKEVDVIVPQNAIATYHINEIHDQEKSQQLAETMMSNLGIKLVKKYEMEKK